MTTLSATIVAGPKPSVLDALVHAEKCGYGKLQTAAFEAGFFQALINAPVDEKALGGRFGSYYRAGMEWTRSEIERRAAEAAAAEDMDALARKIVADHLHRRREHTQAMEALALEIIEAHRPVAQTREQWLMLASAHIGVVLAEQAGLKLETFRVTCGWPSKGGRGKAKKVLGEAWHRTASADGTAEVFITPLEDDLRRVVAILAHELIHTCLPAGTGHGAPFVAAAKAVGFAAPFTQLNPTDALWVWADKIIAALPGYPHARIVDGVAEGAPKKQGTRMLKVECRQEIEGEAGVEACGYTVRMTRKWIDEVGCPICPRCEVRMVCEGLGDDEGEGDDEE